MESEKELIIGEWYFILKRIVATWNFRKVLEEAYCSIEHLHDIDNKYDRCYVEWNAEDKLFGKCIECKKEVPKNILAIALVRNADL